MIRVTVGNNVNRTTTPPISANTTLRSVLEDAGIDYSVGVVHLDGTTLQPGDLDKTFADFGITERCYLLRIMKCDNA